MDSVSSIITVQDQALRTAPSVPEKRKPIEQASSKAEAFLNGGDQTALLGGSDDPSAAFAVPETQKEAEVAAKRLEKAINRTSVQFTVDVKEDASSTPPINFRVVDIETGRVVRQFPPGEYPDLMQRASSAPANGNLFVDSSV